MSSHDHSYHGEFCYALSTTKIYSGLLALPLPTTPKM
ncbi:hypothetical protein [Planococcus glaciei]